MDIGLAFFSGDGDQADPLSLYVQASIWADQHGLTSVWTPERHFHPFGGAFPDPAVASAAIATRTTRIALRSGSVVSPLHDVVEIVERWAMVDQLSEGRVGLTFASGWRALDFALRPEMFVDRQAIMLGQIAEARRLWRGETVLRRDGEGRDQALTIFPRPLRRDLPIWIACGSAASMRKAGQVSSGIFTHLVGQSVEQLAEGVRDYRASLPSGVAGHVALMVHTFVAATDEDAREVAREPLRHYLEQWTELSGQLAATASLDSRRMMLNVATERYLRGKAMIGSARTCADFLDALATAGVDEVACLIDFGIDRGAVLDGLPRIARLADAPPKKLFLGG